MHLCTEPRRRRGRRKKGRRKRRKEEGREGDRKGLRNDMIWSRIHK
jgi:hypothetical protein